MDTKLEVVLKPDIEAVLFQRAKAEGLSLDQFAARVLETMALTQSPPKQATPDERVKAFDSFVAGLESSAVLPESAFERENWYPDR
jgi:hypothetical protein